jgi:hypothetical protein
MIRRCFLALALLAISPSAHARSVQWWYVNHDEDRVLFVDKASIEREGDTATYSSVHIIREAGNPAALVRAFMRTDCRNHRMNWALALRYGADDQRLDDTAIGDAEAQDVLPDTLAAAELDFVCSGGESKEQGFALAIDDVAFAEALLANRDSALTPAALHDRMRKDPATPVIRSTAPGVATFGSAQQVVAGQPIVPPRDYAKGIQLPRAQDYDADESGRIYDIAYLGVKNGQLAFEIRGYSVDDFAHPSSGQPLYFALAQKDIQIREIAIAVEKASESALYYRVRRVAP